LPGIKLDSFVAFQAISPPSSDLHLIFCYCHCQCHSQLPFSVGDDFGKVYEALNIPVGKATESDQRQTTGIGLLIN